MNAQDYLNSFANFESRLSELHPQSLNLERMRRLLDAVGQPHRGLKFIHVAGTKGKGSTCALTAYILRSAGYRVGLYTSPHLYRLNERLRVLQPDASAEELQKDFYGAITDRELNALITKSHSRIDKIRYDQASGELTYFEVLTALALMYFVRRKVDIVVLETGLGGRLDATNTVSAIVNGITPISLDHTALLGKTIKKIAAEKAAIIKENASRVVLAPQIPEAGRILRERCRRLGIKPLVVGKDIRIETSGRTFSIVTPQRIYKRLQLSLTGDHQRRNAAMAIGLVELSGCHVTAAAVARGLREIRWPGRLELIDNKPLTVVDCAHNIASAKVLIHGLCESFANKNLILVLGLSNDKDIAGVSRILGQHARLIIATQARHPRAYHFSRQELEALFKKKPVMQVPTVAEALNAARREATPRDVILAAGSVFLVAEARQAGT